MIVLGLGSNLGDRLANLRKALQAIGNLPDLSVRQVSPIYISDALLPENAPADWDMPYLNLAIRCDTTLAPLDLLKQLKTIEWSIGRKPEIRHWGPRVVDIDILAADNLIVASDVLTVPHANLQQRPFALWPLADVAPLWQFPLSGPNHGKTAAQIVEPWGSRFSGEAPFHTRQINQRVDTPQLVGILNVTPDSFSDGGQFLQREQAQQQMTHLVSTGAEVLDIGAESTSPRATPLDAETEWQRLEPVLASIKEIKTQFILPPKISVDTRHASVAAKALEFGADWINDVSGLDDPAMQEIVAQSSVDCVVMHHLSIPERRDHILPRNEDPVSIVHAWGEKRINELEKKGIARDRIIFDPGIGFGKMAEQSLILLKNTRVFANLGVRVLVGHSRKTFLSLLSGMPFAERDIETMAMSVCLAFQPITYLRVHNVEMCARGLRVAAALSD
jgi:2-amino-4-hydroxy-6-hydroxymethyldihydropteridine diphosphokinase/dihydropteroate synthase